MNQGSNRWSGRVVFGRIIGCDCHVFDVVGLWVGNIFMRPGVAWRGSVCPLGTEAGKLRRGSNCSVEVCAPKPVPDLLGGGGGNVAAGVAGAAVVGCCMDGENHRADIPQRSRGYTGETKRLGAGFSMWRGECMSLGNWTSGRGSYGSDESLRYPKSQCQIARWRREQRLRRESLARPWSAAVRMPGIILASGLEGMSHMG
jgi:hypothetical protein